MRACVLMRITDLGRDTIGGLGVGQGLQPPAVLSMTGRIPAKGVRQDVDIRENHPRFSIMSRRAAESLRHAGHPLPLIRAGFAPPPGPAPPAGETTPPPPPPPCTPTY